MFSDIQIIQSDMYPDSLQTISDMPSQLYAVGNIELLQSPCMSVAGSRQIGMLGIQWLNKIISECGKHTIVSGLALGSDTMAHHAALRNGLPTIAVLPSGVNNIAPKTNIRLAERIVNEGGLLLSEYPEFDGPTRDTYISRNRIIAALGRMLLMPECNKRSGTMHTVNYARDYGKHIVLPNHNHSGNKFIIDSGFYKTIVKDY